MPDPRLTRWPIWRSRARGLIRQSGARWPLRRSRGRRPTRPSPLRRPSSNPTIRHHEPGPRAIGPQRAFLVVTPLEHGRLPGHEVGVALGEAVPVHASVPVLVAVAVAVAVAVPGVRAPLVDEQHEG